MDEKEERVVGDMYLAAAFLAYGISLTKVDRKIPRRQKFIFSKSKPLVIFTYHSGTILTVQNATLQDLESNFVSETLAFPPTYPDAVRRIKSAIHADNVSDPHLED